jgi:hypothetical protein
MGDYGSLWWHSLRVLGALCGDIGCFLGVFNHEGLEEHEARMLEILKSYNAPIALLIYVSVGIISAFQYFSFCSFTGHPVQSPFVPLRARLRRTIYALPRSVSFLGWARFPKSSNCQDVRVAALFTRLGDRFSTAKLHLIYAKSVRCDTRIMLCPDIKEV